MGSNDINHRPPRKWTVMRVEVGENMAEIASSFMGTLSDSGVVDNTFYEPHCSVETCSLSVFLDEDDQRDGKIEALRQFLVNLQEQDPFKREPKLSSEILIEEDWGNSWKSQFKAIHATNRIIVKPSWEDYPANLGEYIIDIDPGMAFGTGMHASTQLSLELIDQLYASKEHDKLATVLDVGTGTGILGMGAALLGCQKVVALDNDIDARVAAAENIQKNHLENMMMVVDKDLQDIDDVFDLVIANIIHNTLIELAPPLRASIAPGGYLILAGILSGKQSENIIQTYKALGLTLVEEKKKEEWSALCLKSS